RLIPARQPNPLPLKSSPSLPPLRYNPAPRRVYRDAMNEHEPKTTHFGYQQVPVEEKAQHVGRVFHSVAAKYDLMNDLMSLGSHRLIKRYTVELSALRPGQTVLDLAGGTGDFSRLFSPIVGNSGTVVLADINESMVRVGRDRLLDQGLCRNLHYTLANAEKPPFPAD